MAGKKNHRQHQYHLKDKGKRRWFTFQITVVVVAFEFSSSSKLYSSSFIVVVVLGYQYFGCIVGKLSGALSEIRRQCCHLTHVHLPAIRRQKLKLMKKI